MTLSMTKMSPNGQVVIPAEIRKEVKAKAGTQFIVVKKGIDLFLKQVNEEEILHELEVMEQIDKAEEEFAEGKCLTVDSSISFKDFDDLVVSGKWK